LITPVVERGLFSFLGLKMKVTDLTRKVRYVTPPQVAEELGVNVQKVGAWIASGELVAFDLAKRTGGKKPRWRISSEALEDFLARRQNKSALVKTPPRRRKGCVRKYF
jgi:hypothetical protein